MTITRVKTAGNARATTADLRGRLGSVLAVACAAVHVPLVTAHWAHQPLLTMMMAGLAIGCLTCVPHLWAGPSQRTWVMCGGLASAMLVAHAWLLASAGPSAPEHGQSGHDHSIHHSAPAPTSAEHNTGPMIWATVGLAGLQVIVAGAGVGQARRFSPQRRSSRVGRTR